MNIPLELIAIVFSAILGLQGWSLLELIGLKCKVSALQQQLRDCREIQICQLPAKPKSGSRIVVAGFLAAGLLFLTGCGTAPLRGGKATTTPTPAGPAQTLQQSENPATTSAQAQETIKTKTYTLPAGSQMAETKIISAPGDAPGAAPVTNIQTITVSAPMPVVEHEETRAHTELGAAQKDTARELTAKLGSLKGIVWVGVAMFLFGLATLFYPPLRVIIGSVTTSVAILAGGLALIVLPTLIVGNELLILGVVALGVGGWFLAHRYGVMKGTVTATAAATTATAAVAAAADAILTTTAPKAPTK
jgi:hypothetical protein